MTAQKEQRHQRILNALNEHGRVRISELRSAFRASEATIRRDLEELEAAGLVKRTHGGAVPAREQREESAVLQRIGEHAEQKRLIARAAAEMVQDGDTIFLGSGSTILYMLPFLESRKRVTIISNSLPVINKLTEFPDCKTVVVGGFIRKSELSLLGYISVHTLEELRADKVFLGAEAIHPAHGLTNSYLEETMTDRAIVKISSRVILLADASKFNRVNASFWGPLSIIDVLITDWVADSDTLRQIRTGGVDVRVVQPDAP